ncbi:MAG: hypothetical protein KGJ34_02415 [Patescibacteria group bacterium]|nr:hypothetical protein [Patescibacteria group bacterium]
MKKLPWAFLGVLFVATPLLVQASTLSDSQVQAILTLLQAFGVDQQIITAVQNDLEPSTVSTAPSTTTTDTTTFETPNGTTVDQSGNVVSSSTNVTYGATPITEAPPVPPAPSLPSIYTGPVDPQDITDLQQWENALQTDLSALSPQQCLGNYLSHCYMVSDDAVLQAKYAINDWMTVTDATLMASTSAEIVQKFQIYQESLLTTGGASAPLVGNADAVQPIINDLQQIETILTTRRWH